MININAKSEHFQYPFATALETIWYADVDKSYAVKGHEKLFFENLCIALRTIKGCGKLITVDGRQYQADADSLILIKYTDIDRYFCCKDNWNFYWFDFYLDLDTFKQFCGYHRIIFNESELHDIQQMFSLLSSNTEYCSRQASADFSGLFGKWVNFIRNNNDGKENPVMPAIKYIDLNFANDISLEKLSEICNMSERSFRNHFKILTGMTPKMYIEKKRMQTAKDLLIGTCLKINVIANAIGYDNQFYFSKCFRDAYGQSPLKFRSEHSK